MKTTNSKKIEGLDAILEKEEVISTVSSEDFVKSPENVEFYYRKHVRTFIPMGDVKNFVSRLISKLNKETTVKGAIVAEYGYGKTSTLLFIWDTLDQKESYLVVPPFQFHSLLDVVKAVYGWSKFKISRRIPELINEIDEIYSKYLNVAIEKIAEEYAKKYHRASKEDLFVVLKELEKERKLILTLTPSDIHEYLKEITRILQMAGYRGLIILVDEFQDYLLSKEGETRKKVGEFREFIWGLSIIDSPLAIIFGMPTHSEAVLEEYGEDILHRLKEHNLYYNLKEIYTRDFPRKLWEKYKELFNITDKIIEDETLLSIGQILERNDLGEGPRSVVEFLKRAVEHYKETGRPYTPIDLVNDIVNNKIAFETSKYKLAIKNALANQKVDSEEKKNAIKLIAAFPQGCSPEIQKKYNLYNTINLLSRDLHGTVLTYLPEGYALVDLQKSEKSRSKIDIIVQKFWRTYDADEHHQEMALNAFTKKVIPIVFQQKIGSSFIGWRGTTKPTKIVNGVQFLLEGTFDSAYPERRIVINIVKNKENLPTTPFLLNYYNADFEIDFVLDLNYEDPRSGYIEVRDNRWVIFHLNLLREPPRELPDDIKKLQTLVNPQLVTPLLLLGLVQYFEDWNDPAYPILESEKAEVEYFIERLINTAITYLFDQNLRDNIKGTSLELQHVGKFMVSEVFSKLCRLNYPEYKTLMRTPHYEKFMRSYINALHNFSLKQRRGHSEISGNKTAIANIFGQTKVATFLNLVKTQYQDFIEVTNEKGDKITIKLKLHPFEHKIIEYVSEKEKLTFDDLIIFGSQYGYTPKEIELLLEILIERGYLIVGEDKMIGINTSIGITASELQEKIGNILTQLNENEIYTLSEPMSTYYNKLDELYKILTTKEPENLDIEELDDIKHRFDIIKTKINEEISSLIIKKKQELNSILMELTRLETNLNKKSEILNKDISGKVQFVQHINEIKEKLRREYKHKVSLINTLEKEIHKKLDDKEVSIKTLKELVTFVNETKKKKEKLLKDLKDFENKLSKFIKWTEILNTADLIFTELTYFPELKEPFENIIFEIIEEFATSNTEALNQWEIYKTKLDDINKQLNEKRRNMYETFARFKEKYQQKLLEIRHKDPILKTRYTHTEPDESYDELFTEIETKVKEKIKELLDRVTQIKNDILQTQQIHLELTSEEKETLNKIYNELENVGEELQALYKSDHKKTIKDFEVFSEYCNSLVSIISRIEKYHQTVSKIIHKPTQLTEEERKVLEKIPKNAPKDLAEIATIVTKETGMKFDDVLRILVSLYAKNRVSLYVARKS